MPKFKANKVWWSMDGEGTIISFRVHSAKIKEFCEALKDIEVIEVTAEKEKKLRSHSANAYAWELMSMMADKLRLSKEEVYHEMLKHYGQREVISVRADINIKRFFKHYDVAGKGRIGDIDFVHYYVYLGSSEYDTQQMSIFIDGIVQECKNLGIETMTPAELAIIKQRGNNV